MSWSWSKFLERIDAHTTAYAGNVEPMHREIVIGFTGMRPLCKCEQPAQDDVSDTCLTCKGQIPGEYPWGTVTG